MAEALPGQLFLGAHQIECAVEAVADKIAGASPKPEVIVPILNAAMLFASDLMRALAARDIDVELVPIIIKRDQKGIPRVHTHVSSVMRKLAGKHLLIVDTIHDSGHTARLAINWTWRHCSSRSSIFACLLCRYEQKLPNDVPSFYGFDLKHTTEYYYGYGMDRNGAYRGLADIYAEPPSASVSESLLVK